MTLIIIPAADQDAANQASLAFDPVGGGSTFSVPLSTEEGGDPTHYWCSGLLSASDVATIQSASQNAEVHEWSLDTPEFPNELLLEKNLYRVGSMSTEQ